MAELDLSDLYEELKEKVAIVWPEVAVDGDSDDATAHGIHRLEAVQIFPFEKIKTPYAVIELPQFTWRPNMGMGNHVLEGNVPIYYVKDPSQDDLADMSVKIKQLQRYLNDPDNDLSDDLGQIFEVRSVGFSARLPLNQAFINRSMPHRGAAVVVNVWLNELADD